MPPKIIVEKEDGTPEIQEISLKGFEGNVVYILDSDIKGEWKEHLRQALSLYQNNPDFVHAQVEVLIKGDESTGTNGVAGTGIKGIAITREFDELDKDNPAELLEFAFEKLNQYYKKNVYIPILKKDPTASPTNTSPNPSRIRTKNFLVNNNFLLQDAIDSLVEDVPEVKGWKDELEQAYNTSQFDNSLLEKLLQQIAKVAGYELPLSSIPNLQQRRIAALQQEGVIDDESIQKRLTIIAEHIGKDYTEDLQNTLYVLEWFYCEYKYGPKLPDIYTPIITKIFDRSPTNTSPNPSRIRTEDFLESIEQSSHQEKIDLLRDAIDSLVGKVDSTWTIKLQNALDNIIPPNDPTKCIDPVESMSQISAILWDQKDISLLYQIAHKAGYKLDEANTERQIKELSTFQKQQDQDKNPFISKTQRDILSNIHRIEKSNPVDEQGVITALQSVLQILEWFYCQYNYGEGLQEIYWVPRLLAYDRAIEQLSDDVEKNWRKAFQKALKKLKKEDTRDAMSTISELVWGKDGILGKIAVKESVSWDEDSEQLLVTLQEKPALPRGVFRKILEQTHSRKNPLKKDDIIITIKYTIEALEWYYCQYEQYPKLLDTIYSFEKSKEKQNFQEKIKSYFLETKIDDILDVELLVNNFVEEAKQGLLGNFSGWNNCIDTEVDKVKKEQGNNVDPTSLRTNVIDEIGNIIDNNNNKKISVKNRLSLKHPFYQNIYTVSDKKVDAIYFTTGIFEWFLCDYQRLEVSKKTYKKSNLLVASIFLVSLFFLVTAILVYLFSFWNYYYPLIGSRSRTENIHNLITIGADILISVGLPFGFRKKSSDFSRYLILTHVIFSIKNLGKILSFFKCRHLLLSIPTFSLGTVSVVFLGVGLLLIIPPKLPSMTTDINIAMSKTVEDKSSIMKYAFEELEPTISSIPVTSKTVDITSTDRIIITDDNAKYVAEKMNADVLIWGKELKVGVELHATLKNKQGKFENILLGESTSSNNVVPVAEPFIKGIAYHLADNPSESVKNFIYASYAIPKIGTGGTNYKIDMLKAIQNWQGSKPYTMTGDINIVMADFGKVNNTSKSTGLRVYEALTPTITSLTTPDYTVQFSLTYEMVSTKDEDIQNKAKKLAQDMQADIFVWGSEQDDGKTKLDFIILNSDPHEGMEIVGSFPDLHVATDQDAQDIINLTSSFFGGLVYLFSDRPDDAYVMFDNMIGFVSSERVKSTLLFFKGRSRLESYLLDPEDAKDDTKIQEAVDNFKKTLEKDPCYSWAHLGLGAVEYYRGKKETALEEFDTALHYKDHEPCKSYDPTGVAKESLYPSEYAYIEAKAHYNIATMYEEESWVYKDNGNKDLYTTFVTSATNEYKKALEAYEKKTSTGTGIPGRYKALTVFFLADTTKNYGLPFDSTGKHNVKKLNEALDYYQEALDFVNSDTRLSTNRKVMQLKVDILRDKAKLHRLMLENELDKQNSDTHIHDGLDALKEAIEMIDKNSAIHISTPVQQAYIHQMLSAFYEMDRNILEARKHAHRCKIYAKKDAETDNKQSDLAKELEGNCREQFDRLVREYPEQETNT